MVRTSSNTKDSVPQEHVCAKEETFTQIKETNERLYKAVYGNGQPGLMQVVSELSVHVKSFNEGMPAINKQIQELVDFKTAEVACKGGRVETLKMLGLYLGIFISISFGILNYKNTNATVSDKSNTITTDVSTVEQAMREGKNLKLRGAEVSKQYEENYQEGIKDMNAK